MQAIVPGPQVANLKVSHLGIAQAIAASAVANRARFHATRVGRQASRTR